MVPGGLSAIKSVLRYSARIGPFKLWQTLRSKNACKACAFGTGGQNGGLHNEARRGIEICNKNIQAHLSDIRPGIANQLFFEKPIAELSRLSGKQLEDLGRLVTPLHKNAGDKHYSPITYAEAIKKVAAKMRDTDPDRSFFYASGRSSNEAAFILQLMVRLYGTNNINNCSYYCHQASGVGLTNTIGTGTATIQYSDLELADCIFVFGANPASNHPRYLKTLIHCRRRGGQVIVVNPVKEPGMVKFASPSDWRSMLKGGEAIASVYVQPRLGGDVAFMQGICKVLIENSACDKIFIQQYCQGFEGFRQSIQDLSWQELCASAGVEREIIEKVAKLYQQCQRAVFSWSMGLTHHLHGVSNIETLTALALLRGMIGKPGAGLLPLRGHSNIQGMGTMGFTPQLKAAVEEKLRRKLGQQLPRKTGMDTMACMQASDNNKIDFALLLGGNLIAANPDTRFAVRAFNKIPFKCFISSTLNLSHVNGADGEAIVFPIKVRDEEHQATTQESMFNFVRLSDGGINRFPQLLSEVELICELGKQLIDKNRFDFSHLENHQTIRDFIGEVVPGFDKILNIDTAKEEFHIDGRTLHQPRFNTQSGKAQFNFHPSPKPTKALQLTTVRSEGQFNSIIFHDYDTYRGQKSRDVVMMNPLDIKELSLSENQRVDLVTKTGRLQNLAVKAFDIHRGNIMTYYPEANVLTNVAVDEASKTPAFKSLAVSIEVRETRDGR
jgi:molybdopterin-dependent oxidoreductase alpha subunit